MPVQFSLTLNSGPTCPLSHGADIIDMKKLTLRIEEQQAARTLCGDIAPTGGYAIVVDGNLKTQFSVQSAAKKAAKELLAKYPMRPIEII
jgi:hypothetical protein